MRASQEAPKGRAMAPGWHFLVHQPGGIVREPILGEFFADDAIARPAQALVRESIQNSLDAADESKAVVVRFFVSGSEGALPPTRAARWLEGGWPHFTAERSGLRDAPDRGAACPFVVVEDFNTWGLTGDPRQVSIKDRRNRFFNFFRAEGVTEKAGSQKGRWGVGKTVFGRASLLNTFIALTVRKDDKRCLCMGRSVLRHHSVGSMEYTPDGFWGERLDDIVGPVEAPALLEDFRSDFQLRRKGEPGLSVVIPHPERDLTVDAIARACGRDYFYAILERRLEVVVDGMGDARRTLTAENFMATMHQIDPEFAADLKGTADLAEWALHNQDAITDIDIHANAVPPIWRDSDQHRDPGEVSQRFAHGERVALRLGVKVQRRGAASQSSSFVVAMQQDFVGRGSVPVFLRRGIVVPSRERRLKGLRVHALVICDHGALSELLGDAESPAHTTWAEGTSNFRGKYSDGAAYLRFVNEAPRKLAEWLSHALAGRDTVSLASMFPRPAGPVRRPAPRPVPRPDIPERGQPKLLVTQLRDGFSIAAGPGATEFPLRIRASCAYDRSRGSALSKYDPADFSLGDLDATVEQGEITKCVRNEIEALVLSPGFILKVRGFDPNRDVYVLARPVKEHDG